MNTVSIYHTLDICLDIANKLKNPEQTCEIIQESIKRGHFTSNHWLKRSLAEGLPGIAIFFGIIDLQFPNENWDHIAYSYLKLAIQKIEEKGTDGISLYSGLTGICFATYICSKNGSRYQKLLSDLEILLLRSIETSYLNPVNRILDLGLPCPPALYNLSEGICSALAYLLARKEDQSCYRLAKQLLTSLIDLMKRRISIKGHLVPGWYISSEDQINSDEKIKYSNGSFNMGMLYGITGCLSLLSLASIEGISVPGQSELIREISLWLKQKQENGSSGPYWNHSLSFEEEISNESIPSIEITRDAWMYGTPAVSRSLYLAGKATKDSTLMKFAEDSLISIFSKPWQEWHLMGTGFDTGRAGLLALTYQMAKETDNSILKGQIDTLERDLKRFYHPNHPFGFQTIHIGFDNQLSWIDHPGLINGSVGMALTLLLNHSDHQDWSRIFLIK